MNVKTIAQSILCCLAFTAAVGDAQILYTQKSLYRNISVYQDNDLRCMKFGRYEGTRQSCVSLSNRDYLVFNYTKMMMAALYLNPSPNRVLIIGLGGGTLPEALRRVYPSLEIDVVEIDPAVVAVAKKFFDFAPTTTLRVFEEDGRVFVKRALKKNASYDLVMLDAFDREYIPEHMLTKEFLQEVRGLLANDGVLAANTFSSSRLYDNESATYFSVFGDFYSLKQSNRVILLRLGGLPDKAELSRNAAAVEEKIRPWGTGGEWLLPLFAVEKGWASNTRVLTDQYSPSNLLNAKP